MSKIATTRIYFCKNYNYAHILSRKRGKLQLRALVGRFSSTISNITVAGWMFVGPGGFVTNLYARTNRLLLGFKLFWSSCLFVKIGLRLPIAEQREGRLAATIAWPKRLVVILSFLFDQVDPSYSNT